VTNEDWDEPEEGAQEPVELALDGVLDLHHFAPREVRDLVPVWLDECRTAGILEVRIIHGKGIGVLRTIVHKALDRHPAVRWYGHASAAGSWGATLVHLTDPERPAHSLPDDHQE